MNRRGKEVRAVEEELVAEAEVEAEAEGVICFQVKVFRKGSSYFAMHTVYSKGVGMNC